MLWIPNRSPITQPPAGAILDPSDPINDGCVLCLPFNEGCGDKVYDVSGNGNHGTLTGMDPYTDWVAGKDGFALDFDGGDDSVALATNVALSSTNDLTLSVWFKTTSTTADQQIIEHQIASNDRAFISLNRTDGHVHCSVYNGTFYNASGPYVAGEWNHVAFSWMTGSLSTYGYVNGKLVSGSTVGFSSAGTGFKIGRRPATGTNYFTGMCANVRCFSRALSTPEIERLYYEPWAGFEEQKITINTGGAPAPSTSTIIINRRPLLSQPVAGTPLNDDPINDGLVLCLPFNEGCGDKVYDVSGQNNHGTLTGMDPYTDWVAGNDGFALDFDGSDDLVTCGDRNPWNETTTSVIAVSLWVKPRGAQTNKGIFQHEGVGSVSSSYLMLQRTNSTSVKWYCAGNYRITQTVNDDEWVHLVFLYDGTTAHAWLNGVKDSQIFTGGMTNTNIVNRPQFGRGYNGYFNGQIANVRGYNRIVTEQEIQRLYYEPWAGFEEQRLLVGSAVVPEGEIASNLFLPTQSAQGKVLISGSGSQNLFLPVSSAQGSVPIQGNIAQDLHFPVSTSQGSVPVQGGIASDLFLPLQSLMGKAPIDGDIAQDLYLPISTAMDETYIKKCQQRCGLGLYTHLG